MGLEPLLNTETPWKKMWNVIKIIFDQQIQEVDYNLKEAKPYNQHYFSQFLLSCSI